VWRTRTSRQLDLRPLQPDGTVARMNGQPISATVQLAMNIFLVQTSFHGNRHVQGDVTAAGVEIDSDSRRCTGGRCARRVISLANRGPTMDGLSVGKRW
jgi:hypothetical protein